VGDDDDDDDDDDDNNNTLFLNWNLKSEFFKMINPENCLVNYYTEQSPTNFPIIKEVKGKAIPLPA
jgi:hypothetical protein